MKKAFLVFLCLAFSGCATGTALTAARYDGGIISAICEDGERISIRLSESQQKEFLKEIADFYNRNGEYRTIVKTKSFCKSGDGRTGVLFDTSSGIVWVYSGDKIAKLSERFIRAIHHDEKEVAL